MNHGDGNPRWDEGETVLILRPEDEEDEAATLLQEPVLKPRPEPHRTQEESDDTASDEYPPCALAALLKAPPP